ncbi:MAG: T9SS type A sorting domain-containing protein [Bacteroidetes bacterium]|nr:T9SS type A sorting domain-containing protein [Bacteroidota bacterium]
MIYRWVACLIHSRRVPRRRPCEEGIFLNKIAKGTASGFSTQEKNYITALAQSCPYTEGKAVFLARALYSLLDPSAIFDNDEICAPLNNGKKEKENTAASEAINKYAFVTPNPTTGNTEIFVNLEAGEVATLKINNLLGEVVLEKTLLADITVQSLNLSNLGSGNFLYTVSSDKGFTNHGKVTIVK